MKIVILSDDFLPDSDVVGGASVATVNQAKSLVALGHEVIVISASRHKEKCGNFGLGGIEVVRLFSPYYEDRWRSYRSLINTGLIKHLEQKMSEIKPDVVLANTIHLYLSYYSLIIARRHAKKVFLVAHDIMPFYPGTFTEFINTKDVSLPESFDYRVTAFMLIKKFKWRYNPIRNILIRYILRKVNGVIAVSQALKEALNQNGIGNVTVIHNGANLGFWSDSLSDGGEKRGGEGRADRASETILPVGELGQDVVLFGGRLSGAKGGELILKAMKMVVEKVPTARLLVVGKKDFYFERMKSKIDEFGISNSIVFTGWLDEKQMREAYRIASVVVTPSVCFDSFPNTNLEALAVGKPVVATCFGGSREIVKDGENGYIVNPFNVESLAKSIVDLVVNKEKSRLFGENGKRLVNADFSAPEMIKKYLNLFSK